MIVLDHQSDWPDPSNLTRKDLEKLVPAIRGYVAQTTLEIKHYNTVYKIYLEREEKTHSEKYQALSLDNARIMSEKMEMEDSFFGKRFGGKKIAELKKKQEQVWKERDEIWSFEYSWNKIPDELKDYDYDHMADMIGDFLCWTLKNEYYMPGDTDAMLVGGLEAYDFDRLMPPDEGIEWLRENLLIPLERYLEKLEEQLSFRRKSSSPEYKGKSPWRN